MTVQLLKQRILTEGVYLGNGILKVDSLINHQVQPDLMGIIGKEFGKAFGQYKIDRILTAEISGIMPAIMAGLELNVPVVYARKKRPITMSGHIYLETAASHTKGGEIHLMVSGEFLHSGESILIIDDFLASGETLLAMARIVKSAGAHLVGVGCIIEKRFEHGRKRLEEAGYADIPIVSLATIAHMSERGIVLADD